MQDDIVVTIVFPDGVVRYSSKWRITIEGALWPRQLVVASEMIQLYKECTRDDKEKEKKG